MDDPVIAARTKGVGVVAKGCCDRLLCGRAHRTRFRHRHSYSQGRPLRAYGMVDWKVILG